MEARYIAVWRLHGSNMIASGAANAQLAVLNEPNIVATVTTDPEPHFLHIDKSAALGAQLLRGIFAPEKEGTLDERLAKEIENARARRTKQTSAGVFLGFEGETDIPTPEFKSRRDTEEFAVCIDAIEKPTIRETFRPFVQAVMAALGLSLPPNANRRIEKIGEVVYLVDPDNGKPIYTFSFQAGSARLSIASPLTENVIAEVAGLASKLAANENMARPTNLLIDSLDEATGELQSFIAAWSALEIFINATFKAVYEARWFEVLGNGAPVSAKPVFERLRDVMRDKYRLADKFLIIASVLDPDAAGTDVDEFGRLKEIRDKLLHALDMPSYLPTEAVQKLLLKYMKLHLDLQT